MAEEQWVVVHGEGAKKEYLAEITGDGRVWAKDRKHAIVFRDYGRAEEHGDFGEPRRLLTHAESKRRAAAKVLRRQAQKYVAEFPTPSDEVRSIIADLKATAHRLWPQRFKVEPPKPLTPKGFVKAHIARGYLNTGLALFWPKALDHLTAEEVEKALGALMKEGTLEGVIQLFGDEGHLCWSGSPKMYARIQSFTCDDLDCRQRHDPPKKMKPDYYKISRSWKEKLDAL